MTDRTTVSDNCTNPGLKFVSVESLRTVPTSTIVRMSLITCSFSIACLLSRKSDLKWDYVSVESYYVGLTWGYTNPTRCPACIQCPHPLGSDEQHDMPQHDIALSVCPQSKAGRYWCIRHSLRTYKPIFTHVRSPRIWLHIEPWRVVEEYRWVSSLILLVLNQDQQPDWTESLEICLLME